MFETISLLDIFRVSLSRRRNQIKIQCTRYYLHPEHGHTHWCKWTNNIVISVNCCHLIFVQVFTGINVSKCIHWDFSLRVMWKKMKLHKSEAASRFVERDMIVNKTFDIRTLISHTAIGAFILSNINWNMFLCEKVKLLVLNL